MGTDGAFDTLPVGRAEVGRHRSHRRVREALRRQPKPSDRVPSILRQGSEPPAERGARSLGKALPEPDCVGPAGFIDEQVLERDGWHAGHSGEVPRGAEVQEQACWRQEPRVDKAGTGAQAAYNHVERLEAANPVQRGEGVSPGWARAARNRDCEAQLVGSPGDKPRHGAGPKDEEAPSGWEAGKPEPAIQEVARVAGAREVATGFPRGTQGQVSGKPQGAPRPGKCLAHLPEDLRLPENDRFQPGRDARQPSERRLTGKAQGRPAGAPTETVGLEPLAAPEDCCRGVLEPSLLLDRRRGRSVQ